MVSKSNQPGSALHVINDDDLTPTNLDMEKVKSHQIMHRNQLDQSNLDQSNEVDINQPAPNRSSSQVPNRSSGAIREGEERGSLALKYATNESQSKIHDVNFYPQKGYANPSLSSSAVQDAQTDRAAGKKSTFVGDERK